MAEIIHFSDMDSTPPRYLVEGMIPEGPSIGFVWGPSRAGKSLLVNVELALAVVNGADFAGRKTSEGSVAIVFGEGKYDAGIREQARLARGYADRERVASNLQEPERSKWLEENPEWHDDGLFAITAPFELPLSSHGEPTLDLKVVIAQLKMIPNLKLVILDALSDFTNLSISNDTSANRVVQGMKMLARELECVVLAIAHPNYNDKRMRGPRLFNAADFVVRIMPDDDESGLATVVCEKLKCGAPWSPFSYKIESTSIYVDDGEGNEIVVDSATIRITSDYKTGIQRKKRPGPKPRIVVSQ
jgi:hypothetical protein